MPHRCVVATCNSNPEPKIDMASPSYILIYLVVLLSVMALSTGGNDGFDNCPTSVTVLEGTRLTLNWRTQIVEAEIVFCDIRFKAVGDIHWERLVGYSPIEANRVDLSPSKSLEWEFLGDNPCMGGFIVNNALKRHMGLYGLVMTVQNGIELMHEITVVVLQTSPPEATAHHDKWRIVAIAFIVLFVIVSLGFLVLGLLLYCRKLQTGTDAEQAIPLRESSAAKGFMKKKKASKDELKRRIADLEKERDSVQINLANETGKNEELAREVESLKKSESELTIIHTAQLSRLNMTILEMQTMHNDEVNRLNININNLKSEVEEYTSKAEKKDREKYANLEKEAKELIETKLSKYLSSYEKLLNEYCFDTLKAALQQLRNRIYVANNIADKSLQEKLIKEVDEASQSVKHYENRGRQYQLSSNLLRYREYKENLEKTMQDKQNKVIKVGDAVSALSKALQSVKREHHKGEKLKKLQEEFYGVIEPIGLMMERIERNLESE